MKEVKIIVGGTTTTVDVPENDEEMVQCPIVIFLTEKGVPGFLDRKVRLVTLREGKLVIV